MPSIYSYLKATDDYTTYRLLQPDTPANEAHVVELGEINGRSFVMIPDNVELPVQPETVKESLHRETMEGWIISGLIAKSPVLKLTESRMQHKRPRVRYSKQDAAQLKMLSVFFDSAGLNLHVAKWRRKQRQPASRLMKQ